MGIVADLNQAKISFDDPLPNNIGFDIDKKFGYEMQSFKIEFGTRFDPEPAVGVGGSPAAPENWKIRIVQNVLSIRHRFVYAHPRENREFFREEMHPSVDMVDGSHAYPFYADTKNQPGAMITRPVSDIIYTSKGYRESSSKNTFLDNSPSFFNTWDQPGGGAPFFLSSGDQTPLRLSSLEKVLIFQTWLVALKTGEFDTSHTSPALANIRRAFIPEMVRKLATSTATLACIPPFSLNFWADVDLAGFRPRFSHETPNVRWGLYGGEGYFPKKPLNRSFKGIGPSPSVKPKLGNGGRSPVISGPITAVSVRTFLKPLGLDV
jgi:hypothetical protein